MAAHWEHFAHDADMGVRGTGATMAEAFAQAALALTGTICDVRRVRPLASVDIVCQAPTPEILLVDFLNAIVYEMATRRLLFSAFDVKIDDGTSLNARLTGEPIDPARHAPAVEVKGATMTSLRVAHESDGRWVAQCVIDV